MDEQRVKNESAWELVDTSTLSVAPGVLEVRQQWLGKQVWCLTPWGQWRRGKVQDIGNDGFVAVIVYQRGTPGIGIGFSLEHIPDVLKLVSE